MQPRLINLLCLILYLTACDSVFAIEHIEFEQNGKRQRSSGQTLVEAQDGSLLFEGQDRQIWTIASEQLRSRKQDDEEFSPVGRAELQRRLLVELPKGFSVHQTKHYLICYNTSRDYARWCGSLYERLYGAFFNFWRKAGLDLEEPSVLPALIFRDRTSYARYGESELGTAAGAVVGYYSLATNRITTFDLTGLEQVRRNGDRSGSLKHIRRVLQRPSAEQMVATVIHEATHQLSFNSGLQRRFADNPMWLSEGLAIYFESPDLSSNRGWRKIGAIHPTRLQAFRRFAAEGRRPPDSLFQLLTDDMRFRDTERAPTAYAEAWALCYYLFRKQPKGFADYLRTIQEKPYLIEDSPEQRIREFEQAMGTTWKHLDNELLRAASQWR